jgi:hypothetical protein
MNSARLAESFTRQTSFPDAASSANDSAPIPIAPKTNP